MNGEFCKTVLKAGKLRPYLGRGKSDWCKQTSKVLKKVKHFSKLGTNIIGCIVAPVPPINAKYLQSAKKTTMNAVKLISKPTNSRFSPCIGNCTSDQRKKNLQSARKRTANAVKPVSEPANERFHTYLGNVTSNKRKITCRVLKN